MVASQSTILAVTNRLSHHAACRLANLALSSAAPHAIVIDMSRCVEATTAGFARLVLLRRELLRAGRDVRLAGLKGQPGQLFEVHRLAGVLPPIPEPPTVSLPPRKPVTELRLREVTNLPAAAKH